MPRKYTQKLKTRNSFIRVGTERLTAYMIIQRILAKHPETSQDQILETLRAEKEKTGGLIAEETLLRLIAARYGIRILNNRTNQDLPITHVVPGLNDVTITGRVLAIYPPKTYKGEKPGKLANLLIADKDEIIRVVLWNDKVYSVESGEVKAGSIVRFCHGYTRASFKGKPELHLGSKSQIEIMPEDAKAEEYPSIDRFATKISEITTSYKMVHLIGRVKKVFSVSSFTRRDMSEGKVLRLLLMDETGEIPVVFWNEKAEEIEKAVMPNVVLQLVNARAKQALNAEVEIHVNSHTYVGFSKCPES
jgi:ssDNA-binding replication factor A large subunit